MKKALALLLGIIVLTSTVQAAVQFLNPQIYKGETTNNGIIQLTHIIWDGPDALYQLQRKLNIEDPNEEWEDLAFGSFAKYPGQNPVMVYTDQSLAAEDQKYLNTQKAFYRVAWFKLDWGTVPESPIIMIKNDMVGGNFYKDSKMVQQVQAAGPANITYQWTKDGVDIPGATSRRYEVSAMTTADAGVYSCRAIGSTSANTFQFPSKTVTVTEQVVTLLVDRVTIAPNETAYLPVYADPYTAFDTMVFQLNWDASLGTPSINDQQPEVLFYNFVGNTCQVYWTGDWTGLDPQYYLFQFAFPAATSSGRVWITNPTANLDQVSKPINTIAGRVTVNGTPSTP